MKLVTRSAWDARPFTCSEPLPKIDTAVIHYTAANADEQANHVNCAGRVKAIQDHHQRGNGWCDIAYNFVVCKHGFVFTGRGWTRKSGATGAANSHSISFCFLGDDTPDRNDPTPTGYEALGELIRVAMQRFGTLQVKGHRDFMATACPGAEIMGWISRKGWQLAPPTPTFLYQIRANDKIVVSATSWTKLLLKAVGRRGAVRDALNAQLKAKGDVTGQAGGFVKTKK